MKTPTLLYLLFLVFLIVLLKPIELRAYVNLNQLEHTPNLIALNTVVWIRVIHWNRIYLCLVFLIPLPFILVFDYLMGRNKYSGEKLIPEVE